MSQIETVGTAAGHAKNVTNDVNDKKASVGEFLSVDLSSPPNLMWVTDIVSRCSNHYIDADGILVTCFDGRGRVLDDEPLIADFGDVLPFLWHFGAHEFVTDQLQRAPRYLDRGLYKQYGKVRLFSNHDWLLGLLSVYRQSGDERVLALAEVGAKSIGTRFFRGDVLIDELPGDGTWRSWLQAASPFNGGYIELWVDLHDLTGQALYLEWAQRLATGWIATSAFRTHGIFARKLSARSDMCDWLASRWATLKARLFKDNTNLMWGLIALDKATKNPVWRHAIGQWLDGFERYFLNDGNVYLHVDQHWQGYEPSLKAAFSAIELLCDLHLAGIQAPRARALACRVADRWLPHQWENDLFPEHPGGERDHLDANLDLIVALNKLSAITGKREYVSAANRCAVALLALHRTQYGYCLAVNAQGGVVDPRIVVKYQVLLMKLALLPREVASLLHDAHRLELLRDR